MAGSCACGIFAIGRCGDCNSLVCGEHGALHEGRLLCGADIQRRRQQAADAAQREQEKAARQAAQRKLDELAAQASKGQDAIERWLICRGMDLRVRDRYYSGGFETEKVRRGVIDKLRQLIAEAPGADQVNFRSPEPTKWTVDAADVVGWLRRRRPPPFRLRIGMVRSVEGWVIGSGSSGGGYKEDTWHFDVILGVDGRVYKLTKNARKAGAYQAKSAKVLQSDIDIRHLAAYLGFVKK
jgi:hypothetical protein